MRKFKLISVPCLYKGERMKQKLIIIILVVSGFVGILINILPPQAINFLTLELTSEITNRDQVKYLTLLFVCSLFIIVFIKLIQDYLYEIYLHKKISIRHDSLYNKLLKAEPLYFQINEPNKVSHRLFTESKKVEEFLLNTYIKLPIYFISLLLFSYVLFYGVHEETPILGKYLPKGFEQNGNAFLASLILLLCPLNVFFVFFDKKIQALASSHKHLEEEVFDKTTESFQNIREIRQNNAFVLFQNKMSRYFEELRRSSLDYLSVFTLLRNLTFLTDHLSKAILLAIGVYLCIAPIDIPELSLQVPMIGWNDYLGFSAMAVLVYAYSNQIFGILLNWRENKDSLNKVNEIMDLPNIVDIRHSISNCNDIGDVRFKSVSFSKNNKSNILHDLNFDLLANKQTAIIGPSGSGKTSILNLISKESITTSGSIEVNQLNLDSISYKNWSNQLGNINQTNNLLQLSIEDNIYMGTHQTAESQKLLKETIKQISFDDDLINQAIYQPIPKAILANKDRISQLHTLKAKIEDLNVQEELFEYLEALEPQTVFSSLTLLENLSYQFSPNLSFNKSQIALIVKLIKANKPLCDMFKDTGKELSYKYGEMPSKLIQTKKYKNKNKLIKLLSPSVDWETHLYITLCLEQKVSQLYKYLTKKDAVQVLRHENNIP